MINKLISLVVLFTLFSTVLYAGDDKKIVKSIEEKTLITGNIVDNSNDPLFGVKITINGVDGEFFSDFDVRARPRHPNCAKFHCVGSCDCFYD